MRTEIIPTGAIDGINTIFTVPTTVVDFLYAIVDDSYVAPSNVTATNMMIEFDVAPTTSVTVSYEDSKYNTDLAPVVFGSTLADLKGEVTRALGTSENNLYTEDKRLDAINEAILTILEIYPVPQYVMINPAMNFNKGESVLPADMLSPEKMSIENSMQTYTIRSIYEFDDKYINSYKISLDPVCGYNKATIYPETDQVFSFKYTQMPKLLVNDSDTTRFQRQWSHAIGLQAASILLSNSRSNSAPSKIIEARTAIADAWQKTSYQDSDPINNKLESAFKHKNLYSLGYRTFNG